jgi:chemotaxis protein methyltransferase CheR
MDINEYGYIKIKIRDLFEINLDNYKSNQMIRRLDGYISRSNTPNVEKYCHSLEHDQNEREKLLDFLTINVSEFYRDASHFEILQTNILPELLQKNSRLNIWSAGCSNGSEPFSIAIILEKLSPFQNHRILATDIDKNSLKKAQAGGPYNINEIRNVPEQMLHKYFTCINGKYWLNNRIIQKVEFKHHDLTQTYYENNFDLIICRNVTIYFSDEAKKKINNAFYTALKANGILFIGATETMIDAAAMGFRKVSTCFYKKPDPVSTLKAVF